MPTQCRLFFALLLSAWVQFAYSATAFARQIAFVAGTATYDKIGSLANPKRDAATVADRLRDLGFDVIEVFDADRFALKRASERFIADARNADLALFYFAGHGIQLFDRNVLLARDADPERARQIEDLGLDLTAFIAALRAAGPTRTAILIDACRNNPLGFDETVALMRRLDLPSSEKDAARRMTLNPSLRGLASITLPPGQLPGRGAGETLVLFAAHPGHVSFDGAGQNSYFVEGLREALGRPNTSLSDVFRSVSSYVRTVTKGEQIPQLVSDWTSDIVIGHTQAAKVRYINSSSTTGRALTESEIDTVGKANRAYEAFHGTFVVQASQAFADGIRPASQAEHDRAKALGLVNGFAIDYDLDRDGHAETMAVYVRQIPVIIEVIDKGVSYTGTPCLGDQTVDGEEIESVEIALRDINGDRRPEVFVHFRTKSNVWGTFCILEYTGSTRLAADRRGPSADYHSADKLFRTLLRYERAQSVRIGEDNTIETCSGSNCHTRTVFNFDGTYFKMLLNQSDPPTAPEARPFRDQAERDRLVPKEAVKSQQANASPSVASAETNKGLLQFLTAYLVDSEDPKTIAAQYAERVSYFGKQRTRAQIITDKRKYHETWRERTYTLLPSTVAVVPSHDGTSEIQVTFEYIFRVADRTRQVQGRGRTTLSLVRTSTSFAITGEDGTVLERRQ